MSESTLRPDDPREWLNRANSNLVQAKSRVSGVYLEDLCFAAQQAAEKATKAVLIVQGVDFPYTHDLARLLTLVDQAGVSVPPEVKAAIILSEYAVESRYPGASEPVTEEEYGKATATAEAVVRWAEGVVEGKLRRHC